MEGNQDMLIRSQEGGASTLSFSNKWDILGPFQVGTRGKTAILAVPNSCIFVLKRNRRSFMGRRSS